ncbi:MAG: glycosyltransferase family 39 protein [Anaerolineae bacterium]|nr:glycosyltransferase family 39 protein [Anaerolineae bacterium]
MRKNLAYVLLTGAMLVVYLLTLNRYGTAIPATMAPEEISFAYLSRSIAQGKGPVFAIPSEIVPSPTEHPRRFYVPVLSYAFALSGWGKVWGFDLLPLRWFNRILGALNLLLLIRLARCWRIPYGMALLAAFWTSMDIVYQLTSNLVRSDMFCLFWVLIGLWAFTHGWERGGAGWWLASGAGFAVALFAHFWEAFYVAAWLALVLLWSRRWKGLAAFLAPCAVACFLWLLFVLQDWEWFRFLSRVMVQDKTLMDGETLLARLLGTHTFWGVMERYPSNSPVWVAVLLALAWAGLRRDLAAPLWQWGTFWVAYLTGYMNPHSWYAGWFTPFGYLALALFGSQVVLPRARGWAMRVLLVLALVWSGYQAVQVGRCWQAAPAIHRAHQEFFQELATELPVGGSFWVYAVPDPLFFLYPSRPDLTLYVGSGYFPYPEFFQQLDGIIAVASWVPFSDLPPHRIRQEWLLPGIVIDYYLVWVEPIP